MTTDSLLKPWGGFAIIWKGSLISLNRQRCERFVPPADLWATFSYSEESCRREAYAWSFSFLYVWYEGYFLLRVCITLSRSSCIVTRKPLHQVARYILNGTIRGYLCSLFKILEDQECNTSILQRNNARDNRICSLSGMQSSFHSSNQSWSLCRHTLKGELSSYESWNTKQESWDQRLFHQGIVGMFDGKHKNWEKRILKWWTRCGTRTNFRL